MTFSQILRELERLKQELEPAYNMPLMERDILKGKLSELYLLLTRETNRQEAPYSDVKEPEGMMPSAKEDIPVISTPVEESSSVPSPPPPKKDSSLDYKTLVEVFLEKDTAPKVPKEDNTVLGKVSQSRITDLKRAIAMNDRFIFIKELFKNDFEAYNRCINDLNECMEGEKARNYLHSLHLQYQWDEEEDIVKYFVSIINRKFS